MLSSEQALAHYSGIGSSMAAAVAGFDPYCTPYRAWQMLTDPASRPDLSNNLQVKLGNLFEEGVCQLAAEHWGLVLMPPNPNLTYYHKRYPHFLAHPDRIVANQPAAVEAKFRGYNRRQAYIDNDGEPLDTEYIQCQWQCLCIPVEAVYLTVVLGNAEALHWRIEANADDMALLEDECRVFWERHVATGLPPDTQTASDVRSRYRMASAGKIHEASSIEAQMVADAIAIRSRLDALQAQYDELRGWIEATMKDAETMHYDGRALATYKTQQRTDIDVKRLRAEAPNLARTYEREIAHRVLRLKSVFGLEHR